MFSVDIPERIDDKEVFKRFSEQLKANKPKKGRKGKGKGKKKKKKWRERIEDSADTCSAPTKQNKEFMFEHSL